MKKLLLVLFNLLIFSCTSSDDEGMSDLRETELKGEVRTYIEAKYMVKTMFGEYEKDTLLSKKGRVYDQNGNLVTIYNFSPEGELIDSLTFKNEYLAKNLIKSFSEDEKNFRIIEYNEKSQPIRIKYSKGTSDTSAVTFIYDEEGNQIEKNWYRPLGELSSKVKRKFNRESKIVEEIEYNPDGSLYERYTYSYDSEGYERIGYNDNSEETFRYSFDTEGNLLKREFIMRGSKMVNEYYNDEQKNVTEIITYEDGDIVAHLKYVYEYDESENWIRKIDFREGKATEITERKIQYY